MYTENGLLVDIGEITDIVRHADVFAVSFRLFPERLLIDTRYDDSDESGACMLPMVAIVDPVAPDDILTRNYRMADPSAVPHGITYATLSGVQRGHLIRVVRQYVERAADALSAHAWARIELAGLDELAFAWAGSEERGQPHYYAIKGPTFLIEYDNTQNHANHIHSVWRDFQHDWNTDVLAEHYAHAHGTSE